MLPSRGIARSIAAAGARRHVASQFTVPSQRLARSGDGRAFGTVLTRTTAPRLTARHATLGPLTAGVASASRSYSLWPFGSSKATPSPAADPVAMPTTEPMATAPSPAITPSSSPAEEAASSASAPPMAETAPTSVSPDSLDLSTFGLDANSILAIPERIGYLRELGLDFGWGPSSMMQWLLEHIHIWGGLDWWACIVIASVAVRAALWVPTMKSLDQTARMGLWRRTPEAKEVASAMTALAAARAPTADVMALRQHQAKLMRDAGIKPLHAFLGMLHIPFGFGIWRVVSNMATIPVPSMETGGLLWFTDLSVPDPFYILPIVAPITMLAMMRTQQRYAEPSQRAFLKIITWVLGPISVIFTSFMPAGVTFYFAFASLLATCQNLITMQPGFRRWAGLTILPPPPEDPTPATPTGATGFAAMRERFRSVVKEAQSKQGGMYDRMNAKSEADRREKAQRLRQEEAWKEIRRRMDRKR